MGFAPARIRTYSSAIQRPEQRSPPAACLSGEAPSAHATNGPGSGAPTCRASANHGTEVFMSRAVLNARAAISVRILKRLFERGPQPAHSIAESENLPSRLVVEFLRELGLFGWVREISRSPDSPPLVEAVANACRFVVVDLGGTTVEVAIVDLSGRVWILREEATDPAGGRSVVAQIARMSVEIATQINMELGTARMAVIGIPGMPDPATNRASLITNVIGFDDLDLRAELEAALEVPTILENDVNLGCARRELDRARRRGRRSRLRQDWHGHRVGSGDRRPNRPWLRRRRRRSGVPSVRRESLRSRVAAIRRA